MASCAVRLEHSVSCHDLLAQLGVAHLFAEVRQRLRDIACFYLAPGGSSSGRLAGGGEPQRMGIELEQARRLRRGVAELEAQLDGVELGRRPGEQQVAVAHGMQGAGAAKGAADFVTADGFAHVMHHDQGGAGSLAQRSRLWHRAAMARVSFSS